MRTDIHSPKNLIPKDYEFVAFSGFPDEEMVNSEWVAYNRDLLRLHMEATGGKFSSHYHGGSCHVCGNINAIYMVVFYHKPTNTYIRVGRECAEKIDTQAALGLESYVQNIRGESFRRNRIKEAQEFLAARDLGVAWEVYDKIKKERGRAETREESIIYDIVNNLVLYGNLSDRQVEYLRKLLEKISSPKENNEVKPTDPLKEGRQEIEGVVLGIKFDEVWRVNKVLVQLDSGHKVFGTYPVTVEKFEDGSESFVPPARGIRIRFRASVKPSPKDPAFAYFSRPTNSQLVSR